MDGGIFRGYAHHAHAHLLHERCAAATVARIEAVRLIDKEHLTDGLVHDFLGLLGGLAHEAARRACDRSKHSDEIDDRSRFFPMCACCFVTAVTLGDTLSMQLRARSEGTRAIGHAGHHT